MRSKIVHFESGAESDGILTSTPFPPCEVSVYISAFKPNDAWVNVPFHSLIFFALQLLHNVSKFHISKTNSGIKLHLNAVGMTNVL